MPIANPLTIDQIVDAASTRIKKLLDDLEVLGLPGNVVVQFHRDSFSVKKVTVSHEESWATGSVLKIGEIKT